MNIKSNGKSRINCPRDNLITVVTRFQLSAGGVYLWNDEGAAHAFMNERVAPVIREKFHADPAIEFYDSSVMWSIE